MARHARLTVVLLAGALATGGCVEKPVAPDRGVPAVTTTAMTREVSPRLRRVCASAARKGTVAVRCPRLVPAGTTNASVLLPRRSVVRPGAAGDDGRRRFRGPRDFYVIEAHARSLRPEGHWLTAAGSARSLEDRALRSARSPRVDRVRVAGRELELRRYPPYPAGGVNGGHVVAIAPAAGQLTYVSVHGHEHADVAIAMLVDLVADRPVAARPRRDAAVARRGRGRDRDAPSADNAPSAPQPAPRATAGTGARAVWRSIRAEREPFATPPPARRRRTAPWLASPPAALAR